MKFKIGKRNLRDVSRAVLRFGVGFIFLIFGVWQIIEPSSWIGYIPGYVYGLGISIFLLVLLNGIFDLVIGLSLVSRVYLRFFSFMGALRVLIIAFSLGWSDVFVRDVGIAVVLFSIFLDERGGFYFWRH